MEVDKGPGLGMERDLVWCDRCTMQYAGDVLLSCTLEICMVLQTNVTPINSVKINKNKNKMYVPPNIF